MFRLILVLLSILGTDLREEKPYLHLLLQKLYIFSRVICGLTMMNVGIFSWTIWAELKIDFRFRKCCFVVINKFGTSYKSGTSLDNQNQKGFEKHSWWFQRFWEMTQQSSQNIGQKATSATMRIWLQVELAFLVVVKNVSSKSHFKLLQFISLPAVPKVVCTTKVTFWLHLSLLG